MPYKDPKAKRANERTRYARRRVQESERKKQWRKDHPEIKIKDAQKRRAKGQVVRHSPEFHAKMRAARQRQLAAAPDLPTRFWAKVDKNGPFPTEAPGLSGACWQWTASIIHTTGYGAFGVEGRKRGAHRVSYELVIGPIPDGLTIDHLCNNRRCVNPSHLEPVTQGENVRRAYARR